MKLATILTRAFGVVTVMIVTSISFVAFYKESLSLDLVFIIVVILGFFISTIYFAIESGRGEPMNFKEVLERHGENVEWEILAQGLCSKKRWTGLISECRSEKIYFVYFSENDILGFEGSICKLDKYFQARFIFQDFKYKYCLHSI